MFFNLGPLVLEMLQAPRYFNLALLQTMCRTDSDYLIKLFYSQAR